MDIVLGVSMTPSAVRMVLVEGENADGPSLDHDAFDISVTGPSATSAAPQQVVDAILGTQESALEGGHRLTSIGIAWTDHAAAGKLRELLRAHRLEDVVMVSELHAASALAQAIGQTVGYERTALLFVERETATLAVVRAADGAVVRVMSRSLLAADVSSELRAMATGLDTGPEPPQAVYVVGSGVDAAALEAEIAAVTALPVHAPQDGDLALARGAALASASTPRYEASTVGLGSTEDTAAGATQMAAAGYMAPLGYSAVSDDDDDIVPFGPAYDADPPPPAESGQQGRKSFVLVGGALSGIFVVGVAALAVTLAVVIRPTADQRPTPGGSPVVSSAPAAEPAQVKDVAPPAAPETIQAPIPVVQEAPRTVVVAPAAPPPPPPAAAPEPAPAPAAPPPAPEPAPAPPPPPPAPSPPPPPPAPAPSPAAPAPPPPPVIVPVPIVIPPIFQPQVPRIPAPRIPSSTATDPSYPTYTTPAYTTPAYTTPASPPPARTPYPTSTPPVTTYPQYPAYPTTTVAPSAGSSSGGSGSSDTSGSDGGDSSGGYSGGSTRSQNPLWPLWPFG